MMKPGSTLHRLWWTTTDADYLSWPQWIWRPYCWIRGHDDDSYGRCPVCGAGLDPVV